MTLQYFFDNAWRWKFGLPEIPYNKAAIIPTTITPSLDELRESEWDCEFERLMRNRLIMGAIRYGRLRAKGKPQYDRVVSMIKRLNEYSKTGNKEILVDVANLSLLEFVECHHPNQHFHAKDENDHVEPLNQTK